MAFAVPPIGIHLTFSQNALLLLSCNVSVFSPQRGKSLVQAPNFPYTIPAAVIFLVDPLLRLMGLFWPIPESRAENVKSDWGRLPSAEHL